MLASDPELMMLSSRSTVRPLAALLTLLLLVGCSTPEDSASELHTVLAGAFEQLADAPSVQLELTVDDGTIGTLRLPASLAVLTDRGTLQVHSAADGGTHVRLLLDGAAPDELTMIVRGLRERGIPPLADALSTEGWVRTAVPATDPGAGPDRIAAGLGDAGQRLLEGAVDVTRSTADRDRLELRVERLALTVFLAEVLEELSSTGQPGTGWAPTVAGGGAADDDPVAVGITLHDNALHEVQADLGELLTPAAGGPLVLRLQVSAPAPQPAPPGDAPTFALRGVVTDLLAAATSMDPAVAAPPPAPGEVDERDPPAEPEDTSEPEAPTEPPSFEEGGVLEEVFGEENPFDEGTEFDCVLDEELEALEQAVGPDARAEVEALLEQGYLQRC